MADKEKRKIEFISQKQIIKEVSDRLGLYESSIKEILDAVEASTLDHMIEADENKDICIHLFTGMKLKSNYIPKHLHTDPRTGNKELVEVPERVRFRCSFTHDFKFKFNQKFIEHRKLWNDWLAKKEKKGE